MYIWCNFPIQSHLLVCVHVFTAHVRPPISSPVPALCTSGNTHCFRTTFLCPRVRFLHCTFSSVWVWVYSSIMFSHFLHCTQRFCWVRVVTLLFIHRFPVPFPVCFFFCFARSQTITLVLITILETQPYVFEIFLHLSPLCLRFTVPHTCPHTLQVQTPR